MSAVGALNMKLYVTFGSPYARLARIVVIEKALDNAGALNVAADQTMKVDQYLAATGPPKR